MQEGITTSDKKAGAGVSIWRMDVADVLHAMGITRAVADADVAVFCRKAAFLLGSGLNMRQALQLIALQARGRMRTATQDARTKMEAGATIADAMRPTFPPFLVANVLIGQQNATLPAVMARMADYYDAQSAVRREIIAAMWYPAVVACMMIAVLVGMLVFVLPGYADMFAAGGQQLPAITARLMAMSAFTQNNWAWMLAVPAFIAIAAVAFTRSRQGGILAGRISMLFPLGQLYMNYQLTTALDMLVGSGTTVAAAMPMAAQVISNKNARARIDVITSKVSGGKALHSALQDEPYIDPIFTGLAEVGEAAGRLEATLQGCAAYFGEALRARLKRVNKLIEPIITLALGILLALVMLAVVLPTFELATTF
jgi:type II secretory pathway component PulF